MPRQDTVDFLTAFAVGTVLGIGATLLLQPDHSAKSRVKRQLKPYRKQMRQSYEHVAKGVRHGSGATSEFSSEVISAGRELLSEFREEVGEILDQARSELGELVKDQVKELGKGTKKARRRVGM
jgi:gas vesicle protein